MSGISPNLDLDTSSMQTGTEGMVKHWQNRKCIKHKAEETNMVLGEGIKLHEIKDMEHAALVGAHCQLENVNWNPQEMDEKKIARKIDYVP